MRQFSLIVLAGILGLGAWGAGGCGGEQNSVTSEDEFDAGDFTGTFSYKDDNCVGGSSVQEFGADDATNRIFITDPGATAFSEGDSFTFVERTEDGTRFAIADDLGCGCRYVLNASDADDIETSYSINANTGDLLCFCFDASADGLCEETFARTSTEF
jgi:hypothetical protein